MNSQEKEFLVNKCNEIRRYTVHEIGTLGLGHIGGSLSAVDSLVTLYYRHMKVQPSNPSKEDRDRFVLSKGHAAPALYAILADQGFFPISELDTLNKPGTNLPSHADANKAKGVDMTVGSLGQGLSAAAGMAKAAKLKAHENKIYCMVGDGECQEGEIWEAAMSAANFKLDNLIVFVDKNNGQVDNFVSEVMPVDPLGDKWKAFGFNVIEVSDGHDVEQIDGAIELAKKFIGKPTAIILNTVKGKGVDFAEELGYKNHHMNVSKEQMQKAMEELQ